MRDRAKPRPAVESEARGFGWWPVLKRTAARFHAENMTDRAASLTYYGVLSMFPALIALVSILGFVGESSVADLVERLTNLAPGAAGEIITSAIENVTASDRTAGVALIVGLGASLWAASGYVGGFTRAANAIYEVDEGRPFWKLKPFQIGLTLAMLLLVAVCGIAVVTTGPVAEELGALVGAGDTALTIWDIAKWPVIALAVATIIALLYWAAPNVAQPAFRLVTPGAVLALLLWLAASLLFALYVANFASYNATYGTLAGVIVFLVWLWITNVAVLLGVLFNAEIERERELAGGVLEAETIALPPRDPAEQ